MDDGWSGHSTDAAGDNKKHVVIPTVETYGQLQFGFSYLNKCLYDDELANCLIALEAHGKTDGYFVPRRFVREDGCSADKIMLNAQYFVDGTVTTLRRLSHQMTHLWQYQKGTHGRGGYHNEEWARKMRSIGLQPSDTEEEGGRETGDTMSEYIVSGGRFADAVAKLMASGYAITWREVTAKASSGGGRSGCSGMQRDCGASAGKSGKRTKYSCPEGDQHCWAKPDAYFVCGNHPNRKMEAVG